MIEELTSATDLLEGFLAVGMVVFFRIGAILATLPAFGERAVPVQVRLIVALSFTLIVAPIVTPGWDIAFETPMQMLGYLIPETIVGLVMGLMLRLFVLALSVAGSIAAQSTSLSQILGGAALEPMPAIGHLLVVSGLALAVLFGLHTRITEWMVLSYDLFPPGRLPDANLISEWGVQRISRAFSLAFMLAAPFVIASLVYNLALGVINKAMPQLMVSFVGAPVVTAGGLFILFLASPIMLEVWLTALNGFIANPFGAQP